MKNTKEIKIEEVKKHFVLIDDDLWRITKNGLKRVECKVNSNPKCCLVGMNSKLYLYHRLYWCLHTNSDVPTDMEIDHLDGNRINNHFWNLRLVSSRENTQNQHKHRNGKLVGCSFNKDRNSWASTIKINKKIIYLGNYPTEEEANKIYLRAIENIDKYNGDNKVFRKLIGWEINPKGYSFNKKQSTYFAQTRINGKPINLGLFKTEQEASDFYKKAIELKNKYTGDNKAFRDLIKGEVLC